MDKVDGIPVNGEASKPQVIYHASANRNLEFIEPRAQSVRDETEGPVVFGTPDKASVTRFIVPSNDTWTKKGRFGGVPFIVIGDRQRYLDLDHGGVIYHLPPDSFILDSARGGMQDEWTSKEKVKPMDNEIYESGLEAMIDNGVQVFFVDKDTFERVKTSTDHGNAIMRTLESENKRVGINFREVPSIHSR